MKKPTHGPSKYYASDKNVFEALSQHKVDQKTLHKLFEKRNIVVSKKTSRESLARTFSRLTHDYYDHKNIAEKLGVVSRRERTTSLDIDVDANQSDISSAVQKIKDTLEQGGDVVHVSRSGDHVSVNVQYSTIDYARSEFNQVQKRDGVIEIVKDGDKYTIRSTHNEYVDSVRDSIIHEIGSIKGEELVPSSISLEDIPSPELRSKFFFDLMNELDGFPKSDVTDVYVYKGRLDTVDEIDEEEPVDEYAAEGIHVERVQLRGSGVTQSKILSDLHGERYYIVRAVWVVRERLGSGHEYEVEAMFSEPVSCTGFSFLLRGVYQREEGRISAKRRSPHKGEIDTITRVIEKKAKEVVVALRAESAETPQPEED